MDAIVEQRDDLSAECDACTAPATHGVQIGPARYVACGRHASIARAGQQGAKRFLQHVATKPEFIEDPDALKDEVRERRRREADS